MARYAELVTSPLGPGELLFHRMSATERLGHPFQIQLSVLSTNNDIALADVIGKNFAVRLETRAGNEKHFHGIASHFAHAGTYGRYVQYELTLRPWIWLLTLTADCRIFQDKTVPDIIKQVFRDQNFTDFEDELSGSYRKIDYCVQYQESDFAFVSRLMEHEGIYYYCRHEAAKHTLVLADAYGAHSSEPGYETIVYYPPDEHGRRGEEHMSEVTIGQNLQPGDYKVNSFDFVKPKADLLAGRTEPRSNDHSSYEIYDYQADYCESSDGEGYAKVRLESYQACYETLFASGDACGLGTGCLFTLDEHPRSGLNKEYLVVDASHELTAEEYETEASGEGGIADSIRIEAIDSKQAFRCEEGTPKPVIPGPQTAIVVGPQGEEIWTDEHGRIKVQFHWDREGERNENSSCWIRVAQGWAGKKWGAISLPRIGQEVVVHFLDGDPDQPIVTGSVYNGDNKVPYALPANQTQSGVKSRSSKSGTDANFNELRFEDKKGEEEVYFHAERQMSTVVEADESRSIGHDQTEDIGNDQTLSVGANRTRTGGSDENVTVTMMRTHSVGINEAIQVGAAQEVTVGAMRALTVGINQVTSIGKNFNTSVGGDMTEKVDENWTHETGKKIKIDAGDEILIETGQSSILMKKDGTIKIKGKTITIEGMQKVETKATQVKSEAKAKNETKGAMVDVKASGICTIKGGLVKIN
jgi:type VI secretion system secreted protein VgrG